MQLPLAILPGCLTPPDPKRKVPITPPRLEDTVTQPTLFDAPAGVEARDKAIKEIQKENQDVKGELQDIQKVTQRP